MPIIKTISLYSLLAVLNFSLISTVAADALKDAQKAIEKEEFSTAVIHLKNQLKETPKNAHARFLLGSIYLRMGKLDSSIKELGRAHEYDPDNIEILFRYADALQASGKYKKLLKTLNKSFRDKSQESQRFTYLGFAHLGLKQLADAKQAFEQSNQLQKNAKAFNGLASLSLFEKEFSQTEKLLSDSLELEPDNSSAFQLKAKLANLKKQHEQALLLYNQLIEKNNNNISYRLERAATFAILKKDQQAKADLKAVLDKVENHPQANFIKAQILLREKDYEGAHSAAQKVLNVMPQHMPSAFVFGATNYALGNYNQAVEYLIIYLSADPANLKAQNLLANVYLKQKKYKQALLILESIPQEQLQKDPMLLLTLGNIYILRGDAKKGIQLLNQAHELAPDNQDVRKQLITAQFQTGELEDAIKELEQLSTEQGTAEQAQRQANLLLIISYIRNKDFDKANEKINQLLNQNPKDTKLLNLKALTTQLKGNLEQATTEFQAIINQDKKNIPAYMGLARIAIIEQNWMRAEKYFKQIINIDPNTLKAYLGLAVVAGKQNNPQMTEQYFLQAIEQSKDNIPSQLKVAALLSQWYQLQKQPEKILSLAKKLEKQHPNDNSVRSFLARSQLLNRKNQQAERTLTNIITYDKKDIKHRILLAQQISQNAERSKEALRLLDDALAIEPDNLSIYIIKAAILIKTKHFDEAVAIATKVQKQFPDSVSGKLLEADIYRAKKQYEEALTLYQEVYQQQPDKKILSTMVDILFLQLKQGGRAANLLTKAVDADPDDIENLFRLASLHQQNHELEKAKHYYNVILKKVPNHIITLNNLSWLYMEQDSPKAVKLAKQAYEQAPKSAAIIDTYGYALVMNGQHTQGIKLLTQAQTALPKDKDVQYHMAYAYEKSGQRNKAIKILETITKSGDSFLELENARRLYEKIK